MAIVNTYFDFWITCSIYHWLCHLHNSDAYLKQKLFVQPCKFLYNSVSWKRMKYLDINEYLKFITYKEMWKQFFSSYREVIRFKGLFNLTVLFSPALRSLASTDSRAVETCILRITSRLHTRVHTEHVRPFNCKWRLLLYVTYFIRFVENYV